MYVSHQPPAQQPSHAPPLQHSVSRSSGAALRTVEELSTEERPLRLEYQAARLVGPALACRCVGQSMTADYAGPYPRLMHHLDTVTRVLLGHIGGGRQPPMQEQIAVCYFLDSLKKSREAAVQPGEPDPFMLLAQQQDSEGYSLLYRAVANQMTGLVKCLLDRQPPSFSATTTFSGGRDTNTSPFHMAVDKGYENIVRFLLEKNVDVNLRDPFGQSALQLAVENGREKIVSLLLEKKGDIEVLDIYGQSLLYRAVEYRHESIARLLVDRGADPNRHGDCITKSPLYRALINRDEKMVHFLLDKGANIDICTRFGESLLHLAVMWGQTGMVRLLLQRGADADLQDLVGQSPLGLVVETGDVNMARLFMDKGAGC